MYINVTNVGLSITSRLVPTWLNLNVRRNLFHYELCFPGFEILSEQNLRQKIQGTKQFGYITGLILIETEF